jgi:tocopherol cyclase
LALITNHKATEKLHDLTSRGFSFYDLKKIWHPPWFQGNHAKKNYFEGWYFKLLSEGGQHRYAFIPGISLGKDPHSFIQVIDGKNGITEYYRFPIESFSYSKRRFFVQIGSSRFCEKFMELDLQKDGKRIAGRIEFSEQIHYPVRLFSPGIMGWYRFVPFMECYHGVVSLGHQLSGSLQIYDNRIRFDGGKGYTEKDWGKSMPQAWVWMQSNHFESGATASFMLSVARIPWLGSSFTGFLGYLQTDKTLFRFATYTGAKIKQLVNSENLVEVLIEDKKIKLYISGIKGKRGNLLAPIGGDMSRTIHESIDGKIHLKLTDKKGSILFEETAIHAGLELVGDPALLQ